VLAAFAVIAVLAACSGSGGSGAGEPQGSKNQRLPVRLEGASDHVAFDRPVQLTVSHARIHSAQVASAKGGQVKGRIADGGDAWQSNGTLVPGGAYTVRIKAMDRFGLEHAVNGSFTVAAVPDSNRLTLSMQPGDGSIVGVGAPITVRFDQKVTDRASIERHMHLSSTPQVAGGWHWTSATEVHFRPKVYWPAGTKVHLALDLNGVRASDGVWGGRSYGLDFEVGPSHVAHVDAVTHQMSVLIDGHPKHVWNTSLGAPEFATRNGTYIVLEKFQNRRMTSCNASITCDPSSSEYYDLNVANSVRLTWSGTFVHSAPWSEGSQGSANVSHGCVNLSAVNGGVFFRMVRYGDVVQVTNSTRGANDLVARGDPGMADWNLPWAEYVAGSALKQPITTDPL
jgi:lipoprotein-anchoring transpeptidase ErfK/SrfK